ncbi:MAG: V-type ATP synthase subunit F [Promethearchaeota archaeon]|jgi:vacuolar-type H+-ATPase subunit F/Vma7
MPGNVIHVIGEEDTVILLSLLGIEGTVINQKNEFLKEFNKVIRNPSIGMVIIAVDLDSNLIDYLTEYKLNNKKPFIFSLPDIFNPNIEEDEMFIEEISKSIGKIIK